MPVDQATLDKYISEVAGDDDELAGMLREKLGTKQEAATRFVGGYMRNADYTNKTQDLAKQRQDFERYQGEYEQRLTQAEQEKNQIMRDLAEARITGAKAHELLKTVKQAYALTDDDLPGLADIKETQRTGRVVDSTPDLDERFKSFEEKLMDRISKQLIPEISGLAILGPVWNDIAYEHERLFGKRLSKKDQTEILAEARKENRSLESVWQDKYSVGDKRLEVRDQENKKKWRLDWEDEQAKANQEAALRGVSPESKEFSFADRQSPIFKKNFAPVENKPAEGKPAASAQPIKSDAARERMGGAERAAAKFIERARSGQLGKPLSERQTA